MLDLLSITFTFLAGQKAESSQLGFPVRRYLWWGKYLTQFQMFQFILNLIQGAYNVVFKRPYSVPLSTLLLVYMISLLVLFGHFYNSKHGRRSIKAKKAKLN